MSTLIQRQGMASASSESSPSVEVAIVGAGPYGLTAAAHLRARGRDVMVFGKPFSFWRDATPKDMLLRSSWWATSLSDPKGHYSFARYLQEKQMPQPWPLPRAVFADYGHWFQQHAVPNVDEVQVTQVRGQNRRFQIELADGRSITSRAVIMAVGTGYYVNHPIEYAHLSPERVSHISQHNSYDKFRGQRVAIIGRGQGALEAAALAHENGAEVHVVSRSPLRWLPVDLPRKRSLMERIREPRAGIASGWFPWGLEHFPYVFHALPESAKARLFRGRGRYGPAGAAWLQPRLLDKVVFHENQQPERIDEREDGIRLALTPEGKDLIVDHVLLGTGYQVDIARLPMLDPSLLAAIQTANGAPILSSWFESSVAGLYFTGLSSVPSFGPLFRFVVGTDATARRLTAAIQRKSGKAV
ncbi:NAD(P)-binding domain-containing protein [Dictyobacter kobayashii]|uniref:Monooxygenase n=1 Tax=Dictyobacter kobayashii TaxID=2014872 RepID=A0A402AS09_9CHLR|nr:NAD(P)-binding domain-containing protein [Dictyobacter kobayashii]GCE21884.1 hypothetical protein KDK_56840 [Dictyobacter kobayashii]